MFKRTLVSLLCVSLIATSIPSYAKFGSSSSRSYSSSSRSSSFGSSRSSSYSAPSAPRQTYAAPSQSSRPSSFGNGSNVGMQRSAVTNTVRPQTPAGSPPVPPRNNTYSSVGGGGYNGNNGGNTTNHNYGNNGGGFNGGNNGGGFGMGSLAMAAFGGYMLNGMLHNRDGSLHSGAGYYNGAPIPGGQYAPPADYVPQPTVEQGGQYTQQAPVQYAPVVPVDKGTSWFWIFVQIILVGLCIGLLVWIVRRVFINKDNSPVDLTMFQKAETKLQNNKETFFINFQKSNKPSGIEYIKANTVDYLFESIQDDVLAGNDGARVVIKALEAEVIDIDDEGSKQVGSVHYQATIVTDGTSEEINEVWHYVYAGGVWKLAGIEQV